MRLWRFMQQGTDWPLRSVHGTFLLLMAVGFFAFMSVMGCDGCEDDEEEPLVYSSPAAAKGNAPKPKVRGTIRTWYESERAKTETGRIFSTQTLQQPGASQVTYTWTPPPGASRFTWGEIKPENPNGPPPYVWRNVDALDDVAVNFFTPALPEGQSSMEVTETLVTEYEGGNPSLETLTTTIMDDPVAEVQGPESQAMVQQSAALDSTADDTIDVWHAQQWFDPAGVALTSEGCQEWIDFLKQDEVFFAVHVPVTSGGPITESQSSSLVMGEYTPAIMGIQCLGPTGQRILGDAGNATGSGDVHDQCTAGRRG